MVHGVFCSLRLRGQVYAGVGMGGGGRTHLLRNGGKGVGSMLLLFTRLCVRLHIRLQTLTDAFGCLVHTKP